MATPLTHFILSEKLYSSHFMQFEKKDFLLGSILPDIRGICMMKRSETHLKEVSFDDISNAKDPTSAGIMLHSLIDIRRNDLLEKREIFSTVGSDLATLASLKLLEDEYLYDKLHLSDFLGYFDEGFDNYPDFDIDIPDIERWHGGIKRYFQRRPDPTTRLDLGLFLGFEHVEVCDIEEKLSRLRENELINGYIKDLYENLQEIIK